MAGGVGRRGNTGGTNSSRSSSSSRSRSRSPVIKGKQTSQTGSISEQLTRNTEFGPALRNLGLPDDPFTGERAPSGSVSQLLTSTGFSRNDPDKAQQNIEEQVRTEQFKSYPPEKQQKALAFLNKNPKPELEAWLKGAFKKNALKISNPSQQQCEDHTPKESLPSGGSPEDNQQRESLSGSPVKGSEKPELRILVSGILKVRRPYPQECEDHTSEGSLPLAGSPEDNQQRESPLDQAAVEEPEAQPETEKSGKTRLPLRKKKKSTTKQSTTLQKKAIKAARQKKRRAELVPDPDNPEKFITVNAARQRRRRANLVPDPNNPEELITVYELDIRRAKAKLVPDPNNPGNLITSHDLTKKKAKEKGATLVPDPNNPENSITACALAGRKAREKGAKLVEDPNNPGNLITAHDLTSSKARKNETPEKAAARRARHNKAQKNWGRRLAVDKNTGKAIMGTDKKGVYRPFTNIEVQNRKASQRRREKQERLSQEQANTPSSDKE